MTDIARLSHCGIALSPRPASSCTRACSAAPRKRKVDLAIRLPDGAAGFRGDPRWRLRFIAAAHPEHPLHQLGRELTLQDLRKHRHLVIRDTGSQRSSGSWLGAEQIWSMAIGSNANTLLSQIDVS